MDLTQNDWESTKSLTYQFPVNSPPTTYNYGPEGASACSLHKIEVYILLKDYSEMFPNLPYFMHAKTQSCLVCFPFHASLYFHLSADKLILGHSLGGEIKYYSTKGNVEDNFGFS